MAGYQFIHVEAYARQAGKGKAGGRSVRDVIAEGGREPGNCPHVEDPQPPKIWLGSLDQVEREANEWAEQATDEKGRKLRKDGLCLLAGVVSLPRSQEKNWPEFSKWAMKYLKHTYGDRLRCVIEHVDESHPHIHFYCVAKPGKRFESVHHGKAAAYRARLEGAKKGAQNKAYIDAMRALQDDFSMKVGQPFGLTRLGPGRRRLTRSQWQKEQKQAEALQQVEQTAKKRHEHYKKQGFEVGLAEGRAQAHAEAQKPAKKVGNIVRGVAVGLLNGWKNLTQAEQDAQRAVEAEDKRREAEKAKLEREKQRRYEMQEGYELELKGAQEKYLQAEEALDFVLSVGGPELLAAVQKASQEREQAQANLPRAPAPRHDKK